MDGSAQPARGCGEDGSRRLDRQTGVSWRALDRARSCCTSAKPNGFGCRWSSAGHELTEEDKKAPCWDILDDVEGVARNGYTTEFCLQEAEKIRIKRATCCSGYNDKDLERIIIFEPTRKNDGAQLALDSSSPHRSRSPTQRPDFDVEATHGNLVLINDELPGNQDAG
jgi:hypothetical protein